MSNNLDLAIDEMRLLYNDQMQTIISLDQKANFILGAAVLVATLATGLHIKRFDLVEFYILGSLYLLLLISVGCAVHALWPREFKQPVENAWKTLDDTFLQLETNASKLKLLSGYSTQLQTNGKQLDSKAGSLRWATVLFSVSILPLASIVAVKLFA